MKRGSSGVCGPWPVAEPSQKNRKRARSLISRYVKKSIDGSRSQWIERPIGRLMREWIYLTGEQLSINAHQKEMLLAITSQ